MGYSYEKSEICQNKNPEVIFLIKDEVIPEKQGGKKKRKHVRQLTSLGPPL